MIWYLKLRLRNKGDTVLFWIFAPLSLISLIGGVHLGFSLFNPLLLVIGFVLFCVFFGLAVFLGQHFIDARHRKSRILREKYYKYREYVDQIREELGVRDIIDERNGTLQRRKDQEAYEARKREINEEYEKRREEINREAKQARAEWLASKERERERKAQNLKAEQDYEKWKKRERERVATMAFPSCYTYNWTVSAATNSSINLTV